jgi:hypothetical protein
MDSQGRHERTGETLHPLSTPSKIRATDPPPRGRRRKEMLMVNQPPVQNTPEGQNAPMVFVNARWRLPIIGAVGLVGMISMIPVIKYMLGSEDKSGIPIFAIFIAIFMTLVIYALLQLGSHWTLHHDRIEYRNFLGMHRTIRQLDVVSFAPDWTGIRWMLRDGHTKIPVGWEINQYAYLRDYLKTWVKPF